MPYVFWKNIYFLSMSWLLAVIMVMIVLFNCILICYGMMHIWTTLLYNSAIIFSELLPFYLISRGIYFGLALEYNDNSSPHWKC